MGNLNNKNITAFIVVLFLVGCDFSENQQQKQLSVQKPNILILFLDDLGYGDINSFGSPHSLPTHNLDALAEKGVLFTRHYADSTCSPSRAALLTGSYPSRFSFNADGAGISQQVITLPKELKRLGYSTHHVGKWHLGHFSKQAWPDAVGFDTWFGFLSQWLISQPNQYPYRENMFLRPTYNDPWLNDQSHVPRQFKGHLEDIHTDETIRLIEEYKGKKQPWFINHWFYQPHTPIQPAKEFADKYPSTQEGQYLAVLEQLDTNVGRIFSALKNTGQFENTLIVVASDNGGTNQARDNNWPFYGRKTTFFEGGIRTPLIIKWPKSKYQGKVIDDTVSIMDLMPTLVRVAGGALSANVDGLDLTDLITDKKKLPDRFLFWEKRVNEEYLFSVLSEDGFWRLTDNSYDLFYKNSDSDASDVKLNGLVLNSLEQESSGRVNVIAGNPEVEKELIKRYKRWFWDVHKVDLVLTRDESFDRFRLTGEDLQRTPGNGEFTFALAINGPFGAYSVPMKLAEQDGVWSMEYIPETHQLSVKFHQYQLSTDFSSDEKCQSVIISANFSLKVNNWPKSESKIKAKLFINGELKDSLEKPGFIPVWDEVSNPTFIGRASSGGNQFDGHLGEPQVYNAVTNEKYFKPESLHKMLCDNKNSAEKKL